jgi:hypothetical protein
MKRRLLDRLAALLRAYCFGCCLFNFGPCLRADDDGLLPD